MAKEFTKEKLAKVPKKPSALGAYCTPERAVIVALYKLKDDWQNKVPNDLVIFESDRICEKKCSDFKLSKLERLGLIYSRDVDGIKGKHHGLRPEGEEVAKRLIEQNKRNNPNSSELKLPRIYKLQSPNESPNVSVNQKRNSLIHQIEKSFIPNHKISDMTEDEQMRLAKERSLADQRKPQKIKSKIRKKKRAKKLNTLILKKSHSSKKKKPKHVVILSSDSESENFLLGDLSPNYGKRKKKKPAVAVFNRSSESKSEEKIEIPPLSSKTSKELWENETSKWFFKNRVQGTSLVLLVDSRERGANFCQVRKFICDALEQLKVPFITTSLGTGLGDYCFALAYGENVIIIPHLIERKSAVDFAASMRDGRLEEQLIAMKKLENWVNRKFEGLETSISYIFEGKFESVLVQKDGIKYVGKAQYPTLETCVKQKKKWKENVKTIETDDMLGTIRYLAKLYENYRSKEKELYRKISSFREIQKLDYFKVFKEKNKKKRVKERVGTGREDENRLCARFGQRKFRWKAEAACGDKEH